MHWLLLKESAPQGSLRKKFDLAGRFVQPAMHWKEIKPRRREWHKEHRGKIISNSYYRLYSLDQCFLTFFPYYPLPVGSESSFPATSIELKHLHYRL